MLPLNPDLIAHLTTDRRLSLEENYAHLEQCLCELYELCDACNSTNPCDAHVCTRERKAACQGRLNSFFYDFQYLMSRHFEQEEKILGDILESVDDNHLRRHQKENERLLQEVNHLVQQSSVLSRQGNVPAAIGQFYHLISEKLGEHMRFFNYSLFHTTHSRN